MNERTEYQPPHESSFTSCETLQEFKSKMEQTIAKIETYKFSTEVNEMHAKATKLATVLRTELEKIEEQDPYQHGSKLSIFYNPQNGEVEIFEKTKEKSTSIYHVTLIETQDEETGN